LPNLRIAISFQAFQNHSLNFSYKYLSMKYQFWLLIPLLLLLFACKSESDKTIAYNINSPSGDVNVSFILSPGGTPGYLVHYKGEMVIDSSSLGFTLKDALPIKSGFEIISIVEDSISEPWQQPWGEQRKMLNKCSQLTVKLKEHQNSNRIMHLIFRAYDDGAAFKYEFPEQVELKEMIIMDENSRFQLRGNPTCWWAPGDWDIYEHLYTKSKLKKINAIAKRDAPGLAQTYIPENSVNTPLTMRTDGSLHIAIHEAALYDYADMTLRVDTTTELLQSSLVGSDRLGYKVKRALPFSTPWRVIMISDDAAGLADSKIVLNLNAPSKIADVSYFKPMKYNGIWWDMHIGKNSWDLASGKHGATTENAKKRIDFAAANGLKGTLIEGWNTGWEHWIGFEDREGVFDFVTPYSDYNLDEVVAYGKSKGVDVIMHHETSSAPLTYEKQLDAAFTLMKRLDLHVVKTGYVGKIIPKGEYHHGQWMVNHYQKVIETAAKYGIAVDAHEPIKGTGIERTWPNFVSREGNRGQEFNAWASDGGNPPEHLPIVAFTRMLAGPFDFTPGVFNISLKPWKPNNQINTTLAQQLAIYVVIYSPIQMACDLPEYYEGKPAFQFIRDVGTDWEKSITLNGEIGDFITKAREEKGTGNWFIGGITDENARDITIDFSFLPRDVAFNAIVYTDGKDAHYKNYPTSISIEKTVINSTTNRIFHLAPGGGFAISLIK
jgi:glucan 1,4-alpha-glucosidase